MNRRPHFKNSCRRILSVVLAVQLGWMAPLHADTVALATAPLASSTTTVVKPNLLFVMDNSGSMSQDYTPDWLGDFHQRNSPWTDDDWNNKLTLTSETARTVRMTVILR